MGMAPSYTPTFTYWLSWICTFFGLGLQAKNGELPDEGKFSKMTELGIEW